MISQNVTAKLSAVDIPQAALGIVTTMELAFAAMFVALLIWSLSNYLYAGEKVY